MTCRKCGFRYCVLAIAILILLALVFLSFDARAQEGRGPQAGTQIPACAPLEKFLDYLKKEYGESPKGLARFASTGKGVIITENSVSHSGSMLWQHGQNEELWCIVLGMENLRWLDLPKPGEGT